MASNREAKVKFTAETGDFNSNIAKANSTLSKLRSELKLNAAEMKNSGDNAELLSQRQEILAQEANASQSKIEALSAKLEKAKEIFGENSTEVDKLTTQLNNAKTAEAKIQAEIQQVNSALAEQEAASREADSALSRLESIIEEQENAVSKLANEYKTAVIQYGKTSTEARQLESQLSKANTELLESKSKMNQAENAARELASGLDKAAGEADDLGNSIGDIAAGNMIADFAGNAINSLTGLEEATRQYRSEQAKLESIAQTSGQSVTALEGRYKDLYSITADETLSSTTVANLAAMGLSAENSGKLIHAATGIWAQYGDSIPLDGLMESINESSRAQVVTGNLADALNWAAFENETFGVTMKENIEFTELSKKEYDALTDSQKAQYDAQKEQYDAINDWNKSVEEAVSAEDRFNLALQECATEEERQQLIIDTLNGKYGEVGDAYRENNSAAMDANRAAAELTASQAALAEEIAPLQTAVTNLAADGLGWLAENFHIVTPLVAGFSVALAGVWLVMNGATIIQTVTGAFAALNAVMAANPIGIVIAIIAGLVVAFIGLWNNCEGFREFWINLWEKIKSAASAAWEAIKSAFQSAKEFIKNAFEAIKSTATEKWNSVTTTIGNAVNTAKDTVSNVFNTVKSNVSSVFDSLLSKARSIWNSIKDAIMTPINAARDAVTSAIDTIKNAFDFDWSLPKPKIPSFSVSGGEAPWGFMGKGSLPKVSITWHAKGAVMTAPTLFGFANGSLLGGGEYAGAKSNPELITPQSLMRETFNEVLTDKIAFQNSALASQLQQVGDNIVEAISNMGITMDGKAVGNIVTDQVNRNLGKMARSGL